MKKFTKFETLYLNPNQDERRDLGLSIKEEDNYEEGIVYIDVNEVEAFDESDMEGYTALRLRSGVTWIVRVENDWFTDRINI